MWGIARACHWRCSSRWFLFCFRKVSSSMMSFVVRTSFVIRKRCPRAVSSIVVGELLGVDEESWLFLSRRSATPDLHLGVATHLESWCVQGSGFHVWCLWHARAERGARARRLSSPARRACDEVSCESSSKVCHHLKLAIGRVEVGVQVDHEDLHPCRQPPRRWRSLPAVSCCSCWGQCSGSLRDCGCCSRLALPCPRGHVPSLSHLALALPPWCALVPPSKGLSHGLSSTRLCAVHEDRALSWWPWPAHATSAWQHSLVECLSSSSRGLQVVEVGVGPCTFAGVLGVACGPCQPQTSLCLLAVGVAAFPWTAQMGPGVQDCTSMILLREDLGHVEYIPVPIESGCSHGHLVSCSVGARCSSTQWPKHLGLQPLSGWTPGKGWWPFESLGASFQGWLISCEIDLGWSPIGCPVLLPILAWHLMTRLCARRPARSS